MHRLGSRAKLPLAGLTVQWWIQHIARATPDWGRPDTIRSPSPGRCGTTPKWEFEDTMCAACTPLASLLCWQWSQRNIRRLRAEAAGFARWCHPSNWRVSPGVWSMNWFSLLIEVVSSSTISARRNRRLLGSVFLSPGWDDRATLLRKCLASTDWSIQSPLRMRLFLDGFVRIAIWVHIRNGR